VWVLLRQRPRLLLLRPSSDRRITTKRRLALVESPDPEYLWRLGGLHPSGYGTPAEMLGRGLRSAPLGTPVDLRPASYF
ncbi:MAG: hypothetical protein LC770_03325, partial [Acidobacteria bacterium]|nr:hypothetical protein [Acidobacteriota bacterium]